MISRASKNLWVQEKQRHCSTMQWRETLGSFFHTYQLFLWCTGANTHSLKPSQAKEEELSSEKQETQWNFPGKRSLWVLVHKSDALVWGFPRKCSFWPGSLICWVGGPHTHNQNKHPESPTEPPAFCAPLHSPPVLALYPSSRNLQPRDQATLGRGLIWVSISTKADFPFLVLIIAAAAAICAPLPHAKCGPQFFSQCAAFSPFHNSVLWALMLLLFCRWGNCGSEVK